MKNNCQRIILSAYISLFPGLLFSCVSVESSSKISNIRTCEELNSYGFCENDINSFQSRNQKLYVSADISDSQNLDSIKVEWAFMPNSSSSTDEEIPIVTETIESIESKDVITSSISSPSGGWQEGIYKVSLSSPTSSVITKNFDMSP